MAAASLVELAAKLGEVTVKAPPAQRARAVTT
jgi:hypothetical protein